MADNALLSVGGGFKSWQLEWSAWGKRKGNLPVFEKAEVGDRNWFVVFSSLHVCCQ
jgi:hypothetical protein